MKRKLWLLLLCLSAAFLLCVSVSAVDVNNETALRDAIVAGNDVKLQSDISLNAPLTVEKSLTLDLDGKTLRVFSNNMVDLSRFGRQRDSGVLRRAPDHSGQQP